MPIEFACDSCGTELSVADDSAGIPGVCSGCGAVVRPPGGGYDIGEPVVSDRPKPKLIPEPEPLPPAPEEPPIWSSPTVWWAVGLGVVLVTATLGGYLGVRLARSSDPEPWAFRPGQLAAQAEARVRVKVNDPGPGGRLRDLIKPPPASPPSDTPALASTISPPAPVPPSSPMVAPAGEPAPRATDNPEVGIPERGGPDVAASGPAVLVPDASYRIRVGDEACVLRDRTPGTTSRPGIDEYARKELAGDAAGAAAAVRSRAVTMLPRGATFRVVEVRELAARRLVAPGVPEADEFDPGHPAGAVVSGRFLDGPAEGRVLFLSRSDVGRLVPTLTGAAPVPGDEAATTRTPRKPRPAVNRAALAAAALKEADAIVASGRAREALQAYRAVVADYPGTLEASRAKLNVDILADRLEKR